MLGKMKSNIHNNGSSDMKRFFAWWVVVTCAGFVLGGITSLVFYVDAVPKTRIFYQDAWREYPPKIGESELRLIVIEESGFKEILGNRFGGKPVPDSNNSLPWEAVLVEKAMDSIYSCWKSSFLPGDTCFGGSLVPGIMTIFFTILGSFSFAYPIIRIIVGSFRLAFAKKEDNPET